MSRSASHFRKLVRQNVKLVPPSQATPELLKECSCASLMVAPTSEGTLF
jgi:hypothetical protein